MPVALLPFSLSIASGSLWLLCLAGSDAQRIAQRSFAQARKRFLSLAGEGVLPANLHRKGA